MQAQGGYWSKALEYRLQVFILINPILRYLTMQFQLHIMYYTASNGNSTTNDKLKSMWKKQWNVLNTVVPIKLTD
jgi:hypothetical protein